MAWPTSACMTACTSSDFIDEETLKPVESTDLQHQIEFKSRINVYSSESELPAVADRRERVSFMPIQTSGGNNLQFSGLAGIQDYQGNSIWESAPPPPADNLGRIFGELQTAGATSISRGLLAPPTNVSGSHTIYYPERGHGFTVDFFGSQAVFRMRMYASLNTLVYFDSAVSGLDTMWMCDDDGHYIAIDIGHIAINLNSAIRLQFSTGNNSSSRVNLDQETRHCKLPQSSGNDYVYDGPPAPISSTAFNAGWVEWASQFWRADAGDFIVAVGDGFEYRPYS